MSYPNHYVLMVWTSTTSTRTTYIWAIDIEREKLSIGGTGLKSVHFWTVNGWSRLCGKLLVSSVPLYLAHLTSIRTMKGVAYPAVKTLLRVQTLMPSYNVTSGVTESVDSYHLTQIATALLHSWFISVLKSCQRPVRDVQVVDHPSCLMHH